MKNIKLIPTLITASTLIIVLAIYAMIDLSLLLLTLAICVSYLTGFVHGFEQPKNDSEKS